MSLNVINSDNYMQAIDFLNRLTDSEPVISHLHKILNNLMTYVAKKERILGAGR